MVDDADRPAGAGSRRCVARVHQARAARATAWRPRPGARIPDFLLVGAKRGGTTSLWRYLSEHPDVLPLFPGPEKLKGMYYFDEKYRTGDRWYRSHFPTRGRARRSTRGIRTVVGEATPYYLYHPLAPVRAHAVVPDAHILVVLRDPVERAYSHYKERCANDTEPLSFADAIAAEPDRLAARSRPDRRPSPALRELRPPALLLRRPGSLRADARALVRGLRPRPRARRDQRGDVRRPAGDRSTGSPTASDPAAPPAATPSAYNAEPARTSTRRRAPSSSSASRPAVRRHRGAARTGPAVVASGRRAPATRRAG